MNKLKTIVVNIMPILLMIGMIPIIKNDYMLTGLYIVIISVAFLIKYEKREYIYFLFGLFGMIVSELVFTSTKVEVFVRVSLFGLMPLWLPFLWAYAFVVIKRSIRAIEDSN